MLSGTGIRDADAGGFIDPIELGLDGPTRKKIARWVTQYANAHYSNYADTNECRRLDAAGIALAEDMIKALSGVKVTYYSAFEMRKLSR